MGRKAYQALPSLAELRKYRLTQSASALPHGLISVKPLIPLYTFSYVYTVLPTLLALGD